MGARVRPEHRSADRVHPHTSASLLIQENADPEVKRDLERFSAWLALEGDPLFEYVVKGTVCALMHRTRATTASLPCAGAAARRFRAAMRHGGRAGCTARFLCSCPRGVASTH